MKKGIYVVYLVAFFFLAAFNLNLAVSNKTCYRKSSMSMIPMNDEKLIIKYTYDYFGNRTKRELVLVPVTRASGKSKDSKDQEKDTGNEIKIKVYPNPSQGMFWIDIAGDYIQNGAYIEVYSSSGVMVKKWTGISPTHAIDISMLPDGIYFLRVRLNKDFENVWKIIKN